MVSEQVNPENRARVSVKTLYGARICWLPRCKQSFYPVRIDQIFCASKHRLEYYNKLVYEAGKKVVAKIKREERLKGVRAVTQDMTPAERLTALVETAKAVFGWQLRNTPAVRPASLLDARREKR